MFGGLSIISSLIRTLPSAQESHLFGTPCSVCSRALPPVWNLTIPRSFGQLNATIKKSLHRGYKVAPMLLNNLFYLKYFNYSRIEATTPDPTVLPPSRIAKRSPSSQAIGVISSTVISTLSPGRHISTPSGSSITPVTSVVLK